MATVQELERAFLNAHNAGDKQAAQALADALRSAMAAQPAEAPAAPPKERTMLEAGKDILAGGVSGVGALAQLPGQLYGLATGDFSDTGLTKVGRELRETGEAMKSEELKRREAERAAKIAEAGKEGQVKAGVTAFMETIKDPALLSNFIAEQVPNLIPGFAVARGLSAAGMTVGAVRGAIGTGAVQQGADIGAGAYEQLYKEMVSRGVPEEEAAGRALGYARYTGAAATVISALAQRLPGGRAIEEAMAKVPGKGSRLMGAVKGGAGETVSEMIEEGGGKVAQNFAMQQVDPSRSLTEGLGETMGMAAVGGMGLGTAAGLSRRQQVETLPPAEEAVRRPEAPAVAEEKPLETAAVAAPIAHQPTAPAVETLPPAEQIDALRARAEAEPKGEYVSEEKPPAPPEIQEVEKDIATVQKEAEQLRKGQPGDSLWSKVKGRLAPEELSELGEPKRFFSLRATKGKRGAAIADLVADGDLDAWLPPELRKGSVEMEMQMDPSAALDRDLAAEEHIKDMLRSGNYLTYNTQEQLRLNNVKLSDLEDAYREYVDAKTFNSLVQEAVDEQGRIYEDTKAAFPEAEAGGVEPPARVFETIPEEPVEEEYFPDQDLLKEEGRGRAAEQNKENFEKSLPRVLPGEVVDGLTVRKDVPNLSSIQASLEDYTVLPGIRSVPISDLGEPGPATGNLDALDQRTRNLAEQISQSGEINPLIVVYSGDGNYILEGAHRIDALDALGKQNIPAVVVIDKSNPPKTKQVSEQAKLVINKDPEHARIEKELTGRTMLQTAQWAVDNAPNQFAKAIAQKVSNRLNGMAKRGIKLDFEVTSGDRRPLKMSAARGLTEYDFGKRGEQKMASIKITLNGAAVVDNQRGYPPGTRYITVLHELLHAATVGQINVLKGDDPIVKELRDLFNKVVTHFNTEVRAGRLTPFMEKVYAGEINPLTGPDELVAWGIADRDMQEFLSEIKVGEQTIMDKLVELIRKILNVTKPYLTALDQLVKTTESILDEDVNTVGDRIISKQYSFGVRPNEAPVQGALFEQAGKPSKVEAVKEKAKKALQKRKLPKSQFEGVSDDLYADLEPVFAPERKTIIDKIDGMRDDFWMKLAQGIADQYRSIKDISQEAYMKARMSKTIDGALEGILFNGEVKLTDGALDIAKDTKGLLKVLEPVGAEVDRYQIWVALQRDAAITEKSNRARDEISAAEQEIKRMGALKTEAGKAFDKESKKILDDDSLSSAKKRDAFKSLRKSLDNYRSDVDKAISSKRVEIGNLKKSIKFPSINPKIVARRDQLSSGKIGDKSRLEVYRQVQKDMNKLNRSVLKVALEQGIIDQQAFETLARDINYIPFYKMLDENSDVQAAATNTGLVNQYFSKALKGGEKPFGDLMENTLRNWSHILSASMKNEAANATIRATMDIGGAFPNLKKAYEWRLDDDGRNGKVYSSKTGEMIGDGSLKPEYTSSEGTGLVKTMIDGKQAYFDIKDPMLLESIMSIGYMGPKSKFIDIAKNFKNMLQFGVTLSPGFKVRNLFRDSWAAMATSNLKLDPFGNVVKGWADSDKNNPAHISALAGGAIFNFGSMYEGDQAKMVKRLIDKGVNPDTILDTPEKVKKALVYFWDKYQEWGNKSEAANRMALYTQLKEKGYSHLEASFYARDLLDFSMQGSWPAFRFLTNVVPFLNARVQGLYKLGRDGIIPTSRVIYNTATGKPIELTDKQKAQQFSIVMVATAMASLALYMAYKDDDEFKKREQWDRDNFWWVKIPGMDEALRLPKPFELGAFGTMAERVAEQIFDKGAEGKVFKDSLSRMFMDTFALNPMPQMFKPLVDLYANKDSFTGAPIETAGMERLSKEQRVAEKTSPLAIALSKVANVFLPESAELSPVQADYSIKGYFGWLGGTASWLSHYAVMPFSKSAYPDNNWTETLSAGFIKSLPATQSKYVTAFYENNKEISQAYADMRHFAQLGQADKVQEILKEKGDKIAMAKFYDNASKDMAKMRQAIQAIRNDENMTGAQKKEEIDRMKVLIGELARQMEEARIEVKKSYAASQ